MVKRTKPEPIDYIAPGSRRDPADRERAERNWRAFSRRIDEEEERRDDQNA